MQICARKCHFFAQNLIKMQKNMQKTCIIMQKIIKIAEFCKNLRIFCKIFNFIVKNLYLKFFVNILLYEKEKTKE